MLKREILYKSQILREDVRKNKIAKKRKWKTIISSVDVN